MPVIRITRMTLTGVRTMIRSGKPFRGYLVGNKVNTQNIWSGAHLGAYGEYASIDELEQAGDGMLFYLDRELGDRIAFYYTGRNISR